MVGLLERNEPLVYWLQPTGKPEEEQIPALKLSDGFYTLSLRMMKAIWRHVRLRKGFHNLERAQLGGYKLRIPTVLLTEKMRTQSRFNVSLVTMLVFHFRKIDNPVTQCSHVTTIFSYFNSPPPQTMRMNAQAVRAPPKNPVSAASKITKVVTEFFLPMTDCFVPAYTPLTQSPDAEEMMLLERIWEMFPEAMRSREDFVDRMGMLYDTGHILERKLTIPVDLDANDRNHQVTRDSDAALARQDHNCVASKEQLDDGHGGGDCHWGHCQCECLASNVKLEEEAHSQEDDENGSETRDSDLTSETRANACDSDAKFESDNSKASEHEFPSHVAKIDPKVEAQEHGCFKKIGKRKMPENQ
jgi:hypothetical protein